MVEHQSDSRGKDQKRISMQKTVRCVIGYNCYFSGSDSLSWERSFSGKCKYVLEILTVCRTHGEHKFGLVCAVIEQRCVAYSFANNKLVILCAHRYSYSENFIYCLFFLWGWQENEAQQLSPSIAAIFTEARFLAEPRIYQFGYYIQPPILSWRLPGNCLFRSGIMARSPCLFGLCVGASIQTVVLLLECQEFYPLSHLPSPYHLSK